MCAEVCSTGVSGSGAIFSWTGIVWAALAFSSSEGGKGARDTTASLSCGGHETSNGVCEEKNGNSIGVSVRMGMSLGTGRDAEESVAGAGGGGGGTDVACVFQILFTGSSSTSLSRVGAEVRSLPSGARWWCSCRPSFKVSCGVSSLDSCFHVGANKSSPSFHGSVTPTASTCGREVPHAISSCMVVLVVVVVRVTSSEIGGQRPSSCSSAS